MRRTSTVELRQREVVNLCNGEKLGYPCDFELDTDDGRILSLIVSSCDDCFSLWGSREEYVIPWCKIECIGEDTILVKIPPSELSCCDKGKRQRWWGR